MASQLKERDPNARDDPQLVAPLAEEPKAQRLKVLRTRSVCARRILPAVLCLSALPWPCSEFTTCGKLHKPRPRRTQSSPLFTCECANLETLQLVYRRSTHPGRFCFTDAACGRMRAKIRLKLPESWRSVSANIATRCVALALLCCRTFVTRQGQHPPFWRSRL